MFIIASKLFPNSALFSYHAFPSHWRTLCCVTGVVLLLTNTLRLSSRLPCSWCLLHGPCETRHIPYPGQMGTSRSWAQAGAGHRHCCLHLEGRVLLGSVVRQSCSQGAQGSSCHPAGMEGSVLFYTWLCQAVPTPVSPLPLARPRCAQDGIRHESG